MINDFPTLKIVSDIKTNMRVWNAILTDNAVMILIWDDEHSCGIRLTHPQVEQLFETLKLALGK
jgi:hypothetical protein